MATENLLKFITCGSVDDGKSTLIGHLLYDAKLLFADQENALLLDSKAGSADGKIDYSLLLDGLMAEREQGITIDVAYRFFTTKHRSFIVADTPGHEEYTRNMAVGASFAQLAILLVDARQGLLTQSRRHARICALMGIRHFVFAVNKMDLLGYQKNAFAKIYEDICHLMTEFQPKSLYILPVSATAGDNVTERSSQMSWFTGPSLLEYLETVDVSEDVQTQDFFLPVQRVARPDLSFRGFAGEVASGQVAKGDLIRVLPSGEEARVSRILCLDQDRDTASRGEAVTLCLDTEVDVSRGCVLSAQKTDGFLSIASCFLAKVLWMDDVPLIAGRGYYLKLGTRMVPCSVLHVISRIDVVSGDRIDASEIVKNEIAVCEILAAEPIVLSRFADNQEMGRFILIDRISNQTSCCGMVDAIRTGQENLTWQKTDVDRKAREQRNEQKAITLWFTGLSGSGKSTVANALEKRLFALGKHTMLLDGDNIRMGLNKDLGFSKADRSENIRRLAEVAKLMNDAGLIVLTAFISPLVADRRSAREIVGDDSFFEVYISTPLEECERRDIKGLYKKAREGKIARFTGISSPYEVPEDPQCVIDTSQASLEECVDHLVAELERHGFL